MSVRSRSVVTPTDALPLFLLFSDENKKIVEELISVRSRRVVTPTVSWHEGVNVRSVITPGNSPRL
jgi:hypothetical protein